MHQAPDRVYFPAREIMHRVDHRTWWKRQKVAHYIRVRMHYIGPELANNFTQSCEHPGIEPGFLSQPPHRNSAIRQLRFEIVRS